MGYFYLTEETDYFCSSFCTFNKNYIAEVFDIAEADNLHNPVKLEFIKRSYINEYDRVVKEEFLNIYNWPYFLYGKLKSSEKVLVKNEDKYLVAYKASFSELYYGSEESERKKFDSSFWGLPGQIVQKNDVITNKYWIIEGVFDDLEDARKQFDTRTESFAEFYKDIFGDG